MSARGTVTLTPSEFARHLQKAFADGFKFAAQVERGRDAAASQPVDVQFAAYLAGVYDREAER